MEFVKSRFCFILFATMGILIFPSILHAEKISGGDLLTEQCGGCHIAEDGHFERIDQQRKTPEGWYMTIFRMMKQQGVALTEDEIDQLTAYLSNTRGLTPDESADYRYALERDHSYAEPYNAVDKPDPDGLAKMCTLCHSYARIALQRRTEDEWRKLVHFHMGQFPTIAMNPAGRSNSNFWQEFSEKVPVTLARLFPLEKKKWEKWKKQKISDLTGRWRVVGHMPGVGLYEGIYEVALQGDNEYETTISINYADTRKDLNVEGSAVLHSGHEWRGKSVFRSSDIRQIYDLSPDGNELTGRWYKLDHFELRSTFRGVRVREGFSEILGVSPSYLKPGEKTQIKIFGTDLKGRVSLGDGIKVKTLSNDGETLIVEARVPKHVKIGPRNVVVGKAVSQDAFVIYQKLDHIRVEPEYALSRLGYGGGQVPSVMAQFDAIGYLNGQDGLSNTRDDIKVGMFSGDWSLEPYDDLAKDWQDERYAGVINNRGLFSPASSGANPNRIPNTTVNNSGNLNVVVEVINGKEKTTGRGRLVVTHFPLYFNAPIR